MSLLQGSWLQTLSHLACWREHAVHDADEGLVAVEEAVAAGEQVALQHALADVLREHGVHDAAVRGEVVVDVAAPRRSRRGRLSSKTGDRRLEAVSSGPKTRKLRSSALRRVDVADEVAHGGHVLGLDARRGRGRRRRSRGSPACAGRAAAGRRWRGGSRPCGACPRARGPGCPASGGRPCRRAPRACSCAASPRSGGCAPACRAGWAPGGRASSPRPSAPST